MSAARTSLMSVSHLAADPPIISLFLKHIYSLPHSVTLLLPVRESALSRQTRAERGFLFFFYPSWSVSHTYPHHTHLYRAHYRSKTHRMDADVYNNRQVFFCPSLEAEFETEHCDGHRWTVPCFMWTRCLWTVINGFVFTLSGPAIKMKDQT